MVNYINAYSKCHDLLLILAECAAVSYHNRSCLINYDDSKRDTSPFGAALDNGTEALHTTSSWVYTPRGTLDGIAHWGQLGSYGGGGYIVDLPINREISLLLLNELEQNNWVDRSTRAVIVEFTVYNANVNLFAFTTLLAEYATNGDCVRSTSTEVLQIYNVGINGILQYVIQSLYLLLLLYYIITTIVSTVRFRCTYLRDYRAWLDVMLILTSAYTMSMYVMRHYVLKATMEEFKADLEERSFLQFRGVCVYDSLYVYGLAFISMLSTLRFMTLLRLHKDIAKLGAMLRHTALPLFQFSVQFFIALLAFTCTTYTWYSSSEFKGYASFTKTVVSLVAFSLGSFSDIDAMLIAYPIFTKVFYIGFVLIINFFLLSIFIAIIMDSYEKFKTEEVLQPTDHKLIGAIGTEMKAYMNRLVSAENEVI